MKKIILKLLVLFLPVILYFALIILLPLPDYSYDLALIDKIHRLKNTDNPKLVLVGGSNLAFGIDSEAIESALGIPVVNMGVHADFSLGRILDIVLPLLKERDILLISAEYNSFYNYWNGNNAAYELVFDTKQYQRLAHFGYYGFPKDFLVYLSNKQTNLWQRIKHIQPNLNPYSYTRDGFNKHGDYIKHLDNKNLEFVSYDTSEKINKTYFNAFLKYVSEFSGHSAIVCLTYPPFEAKSFANSAQFIDELDKLFRTNKILVISKPQDYQFPKKLFYDTPYHLNAEGRTLRTKLLIKDLAMSGIF
jgi:hypothetical protein